MFFHEPRRLDQGSLRNFLRRCIFFPLGLRSYLFLFLRLSFRCNRSAYGGISLAACNGSSPMPHCEPLGRRRSNSSDRSYRSSRSVGKTSGPSRTKRPARAEAHHLRPQDCFRSRMVAPHPSRSRHRIPAASRSTRIRSANILTELELPPEYPVICEPSGSGCVWSSVRQVRSECRASEYAW